MILHYFKKKENIELEIAKNTYKKILEISTIMLKENNFFIYKNYNVSFEIVSIFLIIYFNKNIYKKNVNSKKINQHLISIFISDLDESLRVKGIGDMSIGKYVKKYVKKFYYRLNKFPKNIDKDDNQDFKSYIKSLNFIKEEAHDLALKKIIAAYNQVNL